jgi:cell division protein ZapE
MEALFVEGLAPMVDQGTALRFVHLVDKLYDQQVRLAVSATCELPDLFLTEYRDKGYAKKYQRCLSRLHELLAESATA